MQRNAAFRESPRAIPHNFFVRSSRPPLIFMTKFVMWNWTVSLVIIFVIGHKGKANASVWSNGGLILKPPKKKKYTQFSTWGKLTWFFHQLNVFVKKKKFNPTQCKRWYNNSNKRSICNEKTFYILLLSSNMIRNKLFTSKLLKALETL